ncbi:RDD family protein [Curvivirga aplysinae]|uniref:RDD family protein n=1 Tax=Curvivirga aplysinae TaxID=2529852 RepID=UPI0012BB8E61|nr:RDD family protein [Curvivirga aplysinae]MTI09653.1 RDD family protein [Curvivirga aplysinae]
MSNPNIKPPIQLSMNPARETITDFGDGQSIIGKRIIAYIIDAVILGIIGIALFFINLASFGLLSPLIAVVVLLLPLFYHSFLISSPNQSTFGQRAMGLIQIEASTGQRLSWLQAVIQVILFYMTLSMTGGILLAWCLFDNKGRCLHDILSNSRVIPGDFLDKS